MTRPRRDPDAREVDRIEALVTVDDAAKVDDFLARCVPGSTWLVSIRTALISATVRDRQPLGSFSERDFTCLSLQLALPVPVEPGLRFRIIADDDTSVHATGLVRPWGD
jgi:hypothetical protein